MKVLSKQNDYKQTKEKVKSLYFKNRGGTKLSELLINDEHTNNAIESLVHDISANGVSNYQYEYTIIANRISMRNSLYLNSCFKHFGWALSTYANKFNQAIFKPLLISILDSYKPYFLQRNAKKWDLEYAEKDVVEKELMRIYQVYYQWQGKSSFWTKYKPLYYWNK